MVLCQVVADEGLTAVFVYSLQDLVACCISETWEEGGELLGYWGVGVVLEYYLTQSSRVCDLNELDEGDPRE